MIRRYKGPAPKKPYATVSATTARGNALLGARSSALRWARSIPLRIALLGAWSIALLGPVVDPYSVTRVSVYVTLYSTTGVTVYYAARGCVRSAIAAATRATTPSGAWNTAA